MQNVEKTLIHFTTHETVENQSLATDIAIFKKWLKIDGYMLRGVWPALNSLSIHVTFTAIVPEAYLEEAKMCKQMC